MDLRCERFRESKPHVRVLANKTNTESEGKARVANMPLSSCSGIFLIARGNYEEGFIFSIHVLARGDSTHI